MKDATYMNNEGRYISKWELKGKRMLVLENLTFGRIVSINKENQLDYANGNISFSIRNNKIYFSSSMNRQVIPESTIKEIISILSLDGELTIAELEKQKAKNNKIVENFNNIDNMESKREKTMAKVEYNSLIREMLNSY